jgi:hypothetical protein
MRIGVLPLKTLMLSVMAIGAMLVAGVGGRAGATVIFNDTFNNGSSINPGTYPTPTSNSTGYAIGAAKGTSGTTIVGANDMKLSQVKTSSSILQAQAQFTTTPVALATTGDSIEMTVVFTDTASLTTGTNPVYFGLYNSGGVAPFTNLSSASTGSLTSSFTNDTTGGTQNWLGFVSQFTGTGGTSKIVTRPAQAGASNINQDLVSNAASGSQSYTGGVTLASSGSVNAALVGGSQYTEDLIITLTAPGTASIASSLYSGGTVGGTPLATQTASGVTGGNLLTTTFDSLAVGWRDTSNVNATTMDVNSIKINATINTGTTPEPASLAVLCLVGLASLRRGHRI